MVAAFWDGASRYRGGRQNPLFRSPTWVYVCCCLSYVILCCWRPRIGYRANALVRFWPAAISKDLLTSDFEQHRRVISSVFQHP